MSVINIMVRRKKASDPVARIVCGNSGYKISFDFDAEWDAYEVKTARFIWNGKRADVVFSGNVCSVPIITNAYMCAVGVYAGDLCTTTPAKIGCDKSILCSGGLPDDPAPDVYAQIMELLNNGGLPSPDDEVEPAGDDIPKVFFDGPLQQTKDETVVPFHYISNTMDFSGYAEIKAQGNSTMRFPKKNQTVKMYEDAACTKKLKVDFMGWGKQNKHCYKANWTDLSHARNVVSARLWGDIIKTRSNYTSMPTLLRTSPNHGVVDGFPVKVYADGVYQGRYTLNIPKDKWMANMDDELDNHCILCGEGGAPSVFRKASMTGWTDEIHDVVPASISSRWIEVIGFVMNSTNEEFKSGLDRYIDVQSLIDYHLFNLAMCGMDAYEKNQLFMTYDGIKWYAQVYDMDATWGLNWNAAFVATDYPRSSYEDMASGGNLLYIRLEEVFWNELRERWAELKAGALSMANIINRFERFTDITPEELVKDDYAETTANGAFTNIPLQGKNNVQQIRTYALARQKWVDEYLARVAASSITLNKSALSFMNETPITLVATVKPSDATDVVVWTSSDETVATVENGVVTPLHNGNCVIRATAGIVSASCNVSVTGIITRYAVNSTLLGVTSNGSTSAVEGETYTATLAAKDGYTLEGASVSIIMGGVNITSSAYSSGVITIPNVTGDISITVAAVDVSVVYSLSEKAIENGQMIDTGVMLMDETKDYTVFIDFTTIAWDGVGGERKFVDCQKTGGGYPGWQWYKTGEAGGAGLSGVSTTVRLWPAAYWGARHKLVMRYSNGVLSYVNDGATAVANTSLSNTTNHTTTLTMGGNTIQTIHSAKVWLEAKTDEECLAMVNS